MQTFEIKGVMVDDYCENDPLFEAGILTSCNKLVDDIRACNDDICIKINSYGGSVEGGMALGIALSDWCREHNDKKLKVELGAITASAAANLVALLPPQATILAHAESMLMFHSCSGLVEGSPDILRDSANRMDKVNEAVKAALGKRTNLSASVYNIWFETGREGWLNGLDAVSCGLADGLINDSFEPVPIIPENLEETKYNYAAIAAISNRIKELRAMDEEKKVVETEIEEVKPEQVETEEVKKEVKIEEAKPEEVEKEVEVEEVAECDKDAEISALKAENEELKKEIEALKATCEKLTSGLKTTAKAEPKKTFAELVREIPTSLSEREYSKRFTALKAEHKAEYKAYMDAHKKI